MIKVNPDAIEMIDFPLWTVEQKFNDRWETIPGVCYRLEEEAKIHLDQILHNMMLSQSNFRVAEYTTQHWREDLIGMIITDGRLMADAVSYLDTEKLLAVVKSGGMK